MKIPFQQLDRQHQSILNELLEAVSQVLSSGAFILGDQLACFEQNFANYHAKKYAIGVNSGTDALMLALKALDIGPGDEVITTGNSFITTVSSIVLVGATPILVDIGSDDNLNPELIEQHITSKTKALLPVHWTGRPCNMERICSLAKHYQLAIIEDCAQAISAKFKGQLVGTFGECGAFSLHPFKTLGACGDAGIILTDDAEIADRIKKLRHNGLSMQGACHEWSNNSRLDALQAAILDVKFKYFEQWTARRIEIAAYYDHHLKDVAELILPQSADKDYYSVYHTYIIKAKQRDALREYLANCGIETRLHYNTPIHKQPVMKQQLHLPMVEKISQEIVSLPIYPELREEQLSYIVENIKAFYIDQQNESLCQKQYPILT